MQVRGARPRGRSTVKMLLQGSLVPALGAGCDLSEIAGDDEAKVHEAIGEQALGVMAGPFGISLSDESVTLGLNEGTTWRVCELGIFFCSNQVSVDLGPNLNGDEATVTTEIDGETVVERIRIQDE